MKSLALLLIAATLAGCATPDPCHSYWHRQAVATDRCNMSENCQFGVAEMANTIDEHARYPQCFPAKPWEE